MSVLWFLAYPPFALIGLVVTALPASLAYLSIRTTLNAHNGSVDIAHVPPVREQIAALPAEEVLLRGSNQPIVKPEELLRAAPAGTETGAQELLRPVQERSDEQPSDMVPVQRTRS